MLEKGAGDGPYELPTLSAQLKVKKKANWDDMQHRTAGGVVLRRRRRHLFAAAKTVRLQSPSPTLLTANAPVARPKLRLARRKRPMRRRSEV